jgi:hypothetical protein
MRRIALCVGAAMLVHCGASAAIAKCKPAERETIVCNDGSRTLRIIRESISPSKRYAVGWAIEDGKNAMAGLDEDQRQTDEAVSRSFSTENRDHVWNYLVRLRDGKVLKKLDGRHFGDRERYNHYTHQMFWAPDERGFVQITNWRFGSSVASAYRIGPDDRVSGPVALVAIARRGALSRSNDANDTEYLKKADATVDVNAIENDGTLQLSVGFAAPKDASIDFNMTVKLKTVGRTVSFEMTSIERQKD